MVKILHVMRAPVGGLFRHVIDLANGQIARGHAVGIIADRATGGERAERIFAEIAPRLSLGLNRIPMSRHIGLGDWTATRGVTRIAADIGAGVIHGHGAKGGAYARLATAPQGAIRVYTPHGGSLHYAPASPLGMLYLNLERVLMRRTELFLFESAYGRDRFVSVVGTPAAQVDVVVNGVAPEEFEAAVPDADAADLVFVGELRTLKGVDVLIDAIALLHGQGRPLTAVLVGAGPDAEAFRDLARTRGIEHAVTFPGPMPARAAFARGRCLIVPSRAESLPYVVLEALAAGMPTLATNVGGIPEIFGPDAGQLMRPGEPRELARAIQDMIVNDFKPHLRSRLQATVSTRFSVAAMVDGVLAAYTAARARAHG